MRGSIDRRVLVGGLAAVNALVWALPAVATPKVPDDVAARLTPEQLATYRTFLAARHQFDRQLEMYWALIEERRDHRRKKRARNQLVMELTDYVQTQPPKYSGPQLPPDIAKVVTEVRPPEPEKPASGPAVAKPAVQW